jgi:DNA-binding response OmpR family regulator
VRSRPLVLIVEDEPDILMLLRVVIEMNGYDAALAADGSTALERLDAERPDLVLLDLMLPVMDGWSVLAEMRSRPNPPPVIICSAARSARDVELAEERGAEAVLLKPLDMDQLLETMSRSLAGGAAEPAHEYLVTGDRPVGGVRPA